MTLRSSRQQADVIGEAFKLVIAESPHQVELHVGSIKSRDSLASFIQVARDALDRVVAGQVGHDRDDQIALQRPQEAEVVFARQVVAMFAGQVFFEQQVAVT